MCHDPQSVLTPDKGVRHEIDLVAETKYCFARQWSSPKEQCDDIDAFFLAKHAAGMVQESKYFHPTPVFCVKNPIGKWFSVHTFNMLNEANILAKNNFFMRNVL